MTSLRIHTIRYIWLFNINKEFYRDLCEKYLVKKRYIITNKKGGSDPIIITLQNHNIEFYEGLTGGINIENPRICIFNSPILGVRIRGIHRIELDCKLIV